MDSLAERLRPQNWQQFYGHEKVVASIKSWIQAQSLPHLILTGSPGSGKTSLAQIIKNQVASSEPTSDSSITGSRWINAHAADFSTKEVRLWIEQARSEKRLSGIRTYIFIDEVHRLTRTQQDVLLEPLEKYDFTLVAATTENPGSYLSPAILSRVRVLRLNPLPSEQVSKAIQAAAGTLFPGHPLHEVLSQGVQDALVLQAAGDLRQALSRLELLFQDFQLNQKKIEIEEYNNLVGEASVRSLSTIEHAETLSAFIKSIRGSDPEAALLWMAQMLETGTDPRVIARRMVIAASEDIGNAEPRALPLAVAAAQAADFVGPAEIPIVLAQAVVFLATAPKSNSSYLAVKKAQALFKEQGPFKVPPYLTAMGGREYENPHETAHGYSKQSYWPNKSQRTPFLQLTPRGFEKKMSEYWDWIRGKSSPPSD